MRLFATKYAYYSSSHTLTHISTLLFFIFLGQHCAVAADIPSTYSPFPGIPKVRFGNNLKSRTNQPKLSRQRISAAQNTLGKHLLAQGGALYGWGDFWEGAFWEKPSFLP